MAIYFISDIHLSTARMGKRELIGNEFHSNENQNKGEVAKEQSFSNGELSRNTLPSEFEKYLKLKQFLLEIEKDAEYLYLLGDVFDFWFEYKNAIFTRYFDFLVDIRNLIRKGVKVRFFCGNHDFWGGDFLTSIGMEVYKEPAILEHFGKKLFVGHGDGYAKSDWGYNYLLKPVLRNPVSTFLFRLIHPDLALSLGRIVSGSSRHYTGSREFPFRKEYIEIAKSKFEKQEIDIMIHGHTHEAKRLVFDGGIYVDTGNFFKDFTYVKMESKTIEIKKI